VGLALAGDQAADAHLWHDASEVLVEGPHVPGHADLRGVLEGHQHLRVEGLVRVDHGVNGAAQVLVLAHVGLGQRPVGMIILIVGGGLPGRGRCSKKAGPGVGGIGELVVAKRVVLLGQVLALDSVHASKRTILRNGRDAVALNVARGLPNALGTGLVVRGARPCTHIVKTATLRHPVSTPQMLKGWTPNARVIAKRCKLYFPFSRQRLLLLLELFLVGDGVLSGAHLFRLDLLLLAALLAGFL